MPSPYYTEPANIMPGLQMLGRGLERRAEYEKERVKTAKTEKLRKEAEQMIGKDPEDIARFVAKNPEAKDLFKDAIGAQNEAMLNISRQYLINQQDPSELHIAEAEKDIIEGRNPTGNIEMAREMMSEKGREEATKMHESVLAMLDPTGYKAYKKQQGKEDGDIDAAFKKQKTGAYLVKNKDTGETQIIAGVFDPKTGDMTVEGGELPEGFEPVSKLGETGAEETERKVGEKEKKTRVVKTEQRYSNLVDRGITSAESTATIRRGIELLDSIKTGGFNAASLRAKQIFGIESADEGELSNSLGKAVLSQLRETFGAAFTENEGNRLARIEASFGKSPEANKRLLKQSLSLAERTARRAMDAAYKRGDMNTVNDINELLTFTLTGDEGKEEAQKPADGMQVLKFDAQGNLIQ